MVCRQVQSQMVAGLLDCYVLLCATEPLTDVTYVVPSHAAPRLMPVHICGSRYMRASCAAARGGMPGMRGTPLVTEAIATACREGGIYNTMNAYSMLLYLLHSPAARGAGRAAWPTHLTPALRILIAARPPTCPAQLSEAALSPSTFNNHIRTVSTCH